MSQIATLPNTILRPPSLAVPQARGAGWAAEQTYIDWLLEFYGNSVVALWRQDDVGSVAFDAGPNRLNGVHVGATPKQSDIPWAADRPVAMEYDGATRYTNIYSTGLAARFNEAEGSIIVPAKMANAGVWTDGAQRFVFIVGVDIATNYVAAYKRTANNSFGVDYVAGGTAKGVVSTISFAGLFLIQITWIILEDKMKVYFNGNQQGTTQTGLGVWSGALGSTRCVIGAASTVPATVWSGPIGPVALLSRAAQGWEVAKTYAKFIQAMGGA